jgi:hypothetical protein
MVSYCSFDGCTANQGGGAICWSGPNGNVSDSNFMNCHANNGGGIYFADDATDCSLIDAIFDGNTADEGPDYYNVTSINVIETKTPTNLEANDVSIIYGNSGNLAVTLTDENEQGIADQQIYVTLDDVEHELTTGANGQASFAIPNNLAVGKYVATISYKGNKHYKRSSTTSKINVRSEGYGTFTDLARDIATAENELSLTRNYIYDEITDSDYNDGVTIDKSIVINGNNFTINGNKQVRILSSNLLM